VLGRMMSADCCGLVGGGSRLAGRSTIDSQALHSSIYVLRRHNLQGESNSCGSGLTQRGGCSNV
jgi:hypothetical protein